MLEEIIPNVKTSIHSGCEKDGRTNRAPAPISKICHMLPIRDRIGIFIRVNLIKFYKHGLQID